MTEIIIAVISFTAIVLVLSLLVLAARRALVPSGTCEVLVNDTRTIPVAAGQRLLHALNSAGINLPSACGGAGTCGLCKVKVVAGESEPAPQDLALLPRIEIRNGIRLACQVSVIDEMKVEVDEVYFGVKTWQCRVQSVRNVSTLIKEIVLQLPEGEHMQFRPGSFVQTTCPVYQLDFQQIQVDDAYRDSWDALRLGSLKAGCDEPVTRAYSIANSPDQVDCISLNVRIALPPPTNRVPPGVLSSWLFSLVPGDVVETSGPYGHFHVAPGEHEAIFIGGGVGMAPLYAQIRDLLEKQSTGRRISFWYGARSLQELYYGEVFDELQERFDNFSWHVVLSEPREEDSWQGLNGLVHTAIFEDYLEQHPEPDACEYYLCGPPLMIKAVIAMLDGLGVDAGSIHYDDFGGG